MDNLNKNPILITDLSELHNLVNKLQNYCKNLLEENKKLIKQNEELVEKRDNCLDKLGLDILKYFNRCKSIKETSEKYDMTIDELIDWIPYWDGCSDGLKSAKDYKDYVSQEANDEEEDDNSENDSDNDSDNDSNEEIIDDYDCCKFCNKNSIEFSCTDCGTKVCYPCRSRCMNCMETICPNCNNEKRLCSKCFK